MRLLDLTLVVSMLAAAGTATWCALASRSGPPPKASPGPPPGVKFELHDMMDPAFVEAAPVPDAPPGKLVARLPDGGRIAGWTVATVFATHEGRPQYSDWRDLAVAQFGDALDLRRWMSSKKERPQGVHYANFTLAVERDGRLEYRTGWVRFDVNALRDRSYAFDVPPRAASTVRVTDADGLPVPGALVLVDPRVPGPFGTATAFGAADASGEVRFSGLDPRKSWVARLPEGAGPLAGPGERHFQAGEGEVEVRLAGSVAGCEFERLDVLLPFPSASVRVQSVVPGGGRGEASAVAAWIPPGHGGRAPLWIARTGEARDGRPPSVRFEHIGLVTAERKDAESSVATLDLSVFLTKGSGSCGEPR